MQPPPLAIDDISSLSHQPINRIDNGNPSFIFEPDSAPFYSQGFATPDDALLPEPFAFTAAGFTGSPLFSQTLDSADAATLVGTWSDLSLSGATGGDAKIIDALSGSPSATWIFSDLDPNRTYALNVNLPDLETSGLALTALAEYRVEGVLSSVIDIPTDGSAQVGSNGERYFRLGDFQPDSSGVLSIALAFTDAPLQPETLADNPAGFSEVDIIGDADGIAATIGDAAATYDFDPARVIDGTGADLRLHAISSGGDPFADVDVLVSADGVSFISVKGTETAGTPDAEGLVSATYDIGASGLSTVRFVRIQGTSTSLPGEGGFRLDSLEAINVIPSGVLLADAVTIEEHNASILIAEPFGDKS